MSADTTSDPIPKTESKSARKKKAKTETKPAPEAGASTNSTTPQHRPSDPAVSSDGPAAETIANGVEGQNDSPYIKEIQKNIRNVNKKLNAMQKVDSIISENPGQSLDELVKEKKINQDQKAQALKKPALQASLAQLEEQLTQYKTFDQEAQQRLAAEKEALQTAHKDELEKLRSTLKAEAEAEALKEGRERLLIFSKFLRAAAARRQLEDSESEESKAFEGALLLVYGGDANAVAAAEKIIEGADEGVPSTEGSILSVTYSQIKLSCLAYSPFATEEAWVEDVAQAESTSTETVAADNTPATAEVTAMPAETDTEQTSVPTEEHPAEAQPAEAQPTAPLAETDPTIVHATPTEIQNGATALDGTGSNVELTDAPEQTGIDAGAANAAAEEHWDNKGAEATNTLTDSWVSVAPRDPAETENRPTPAPNNSTQSWADDAPVQPPAYAEPAPTTTAKESGDGFHEVVHGRGGRGGRGRGEYHGGGRGRGGGRGGGRGDYRGGRGDYRGRGRGDGHRGGGYRGGRGQDAAPAAS